MEPGTLLDGSPAARSSARHFPPPRRARVLPTAAAERTTNGSGRAHTLRGFPHNEAPFRVVGGAVASQVLKMTGGEGFMLNFLFGKALRSSSQAVVARKNLDCRDFLCAIAAVVEYRQAA